MTMKITHDQAYELRDWLTDAIANSLGRAEAECRLDDRLALDVAMDAVQDGLVTIDGELEDTATYFGLEGE
jgi:hypothetical protein